MGQALRLGLAQLRFTLGARKCFRIGVAGYSSKYFDEDLARKLLEQAIRQVSSFNKEELPIAIVSGLTALGIPLLAYELADKKGYRTVGYACKKAKDFVCYDVDEANLVGSNWGDESKKFLSNIDALIAIGGGKQTQAEVEQARENGLPVVTCTLPLMKSHCLMGYLDEESAKWLFEASKGTTGKNVYPKDEYHVTVRYWKVDGEDDEHTRAISKDLKDLLKKVDTPEIEITGKTDIFGGEEKSYVLHVESKMLEGLFSKVDKIVLKNGGTEHAYGSYKAHLTLGEDIQNVPKIEKKTLKIGRWVFTEKRDRFIDSEILWELK